MTKTKPATQVSGYIGGEKVGFLEDEEVLEILRNEYGLDVDYSKAGSLDMMTADLSGRNYLSLPAALHWNITKNFTDRQSRVRLF